MKSLGRVHTDRKRTRKRSFTISGFRNAVADPEFPRREGEPWVWSKNLLVFAKSGMEMKEIEPGGRGAHP